MATYPSALPTIPDDGTWTHAQVAREVEAVAAELGVNPSGAQTDVAARLGVVEGRVTAVEGATSTAGVELQSAQLVADYSIFGQASNTTYTDIGLSIAVPAQTRAYNVFFDCTFVATTNASFVGPKLVAPVARIVDSAVTGVWESSQFPIVFPVSGGLTLFTKGLLKARIPAGQAATTYKVQARASAALDANVTALAIYAGTAPATPIIGVSRNPAQLQAITV